MSRPLYFESKGVIFLFILSLPAIFFSEIKYYFVGEVNGLETLIYVYSVYKSSVRVQYKTIRQQQCNGSRIEGNLDFFRFVLIRSIPVKSTKNDTGPRGF